MENFRGGQSRLAQLFIFVQDHSPDGVNRSVAKIGKKKKGPVTYQMSISVGHTTKVYVDLLPFFSIFGFHVSN